MSKPRSPKPRRFTDHALDNYIEHWANPNARSELKRKNYENDLRQIVSQALPGEWIEKDKQQIWTWEGYYTRFGKVCLVRLLVDTEGVVCSVLPENSDLVLQHHDIEEARDAPSN